MLVERLQILSMILILVFEDSIFIYIVICWVL